MFKDVFKLKKDAWHSRLMKYTWNLNFYDFSHMCPYFWLTALNIVIFPFVFFIKFVLRDCILGSLDWLAEKYNAHIDKLEQKWQEEYFAELQKNPKNWEDLFKINLDLDKNSKYRKFIYRKVQSSVSEEEWNAIYNRLQQEYEKRYELQRKLEYENTLKKRAKFQAQEMRAKTNKERINSILKIVKPIMTVFLYIVSFLGIVTIILLLYKFIHWLTTVKIHAWIKFGQIVGIIFLIIVLAILIVFGLKWLKGYIDNRFEARKIVNADYNNKVERTYKRINGVFEKLCKVIAWPFVMIWKGILLIVQMLKDSCPAIQWED